MINEITFPAGVNLGDPVEGKLSNGASIGIHE
jgi:hypothetical protein